MKAANAPACAVSMVVSERFELSKWAFVGVPEIHTMRMSVFVFLDDIRLAASRSGV